MHFYDSHAHLSSCEVLPDIDGVMERAEMARVTQVLNICTNSKTLEEGLHLEKRYPGIKNAGATTPHDVEKEGDSAFPLFEEAAKKGGLAAVGETGLDYYYQELDVQTQKKFFIRYLHLAASCRLPVIFHCREAFDDLFDIADCEYPKGFPAVLHCFTGNATEAKKVLERGWHLSLSGIVTYKKSEALREVAKMVPLNQLLIETDTPYLAPQSRRGKPNEPAFVVETAECIAKVKGVDLETLAKATSRNAETLFGFNP